MTTTVGTVDNVKFGNDYGMFTVLNASDGQLETFVLWSGDFSPGGPTALYTMVVTLAAAKKLTVQIVHGDTSAFVDQIQLMAPP